MTRELAGQHPVAKNSFQSMLDAEPSADAILACLESLCAKTRPYPIKEFVFCGAGEPLVRLDVVVTVSQWLKSRDFKVRINTNGHALLMHGSAAVETIQEITDAISISLNAHNRTIYNRISNPAAQEASYPSLLVFAEQCAKSIPEVTLSAVSLRPKEKAAIRDSIDLDACAKISEAIGVRFRIR
ncbi:MAG: TatD family nuclease-associated radical SAM protein [Planctomycetota bacterium]